MWPDSVLERLGSLWVSVINIGLARSGVCFRIGSTLVERNLCAHAVVVGISIVLEERPRFPLAEHESTKCGFTIWHVCKESLMLLLYFASLLCLLNDRRPIVFGQDRHEAQAKLPDAQTRSLGVALGVGCLEVDLQPMTVQRLNPVEECWIDC